MYSLRAISICLVTCCLASFAVSAEEEKPVDFTRDIRPILTGRCFRCHGPDGETREAGLRLDVREDATAELESGERAIVPGEPTSSMLIERVASDEPYYRMPPEGTGQPLNADEIDLLTRWIASGAEYTRHWSFVKPERPSLPEVSDANWPSGGIDHFVLVRLEREGLSPSPEADRYTLIRRVSLDLTGLPPTVDEVDAFVNDESPDAYETLVDRLLASPAYGERWAQVWVDLARVTRKTRRGRSGAIAIG